MMKSSLTDKFLALALFTLTVIHTTSHFKAEAENRIASPLPPCSALNHSIGKQVEIYGQIVQIGSDAPASDSGGLMIELSTGSDCRLDTWVVAREWQSWDSTQRDLIAVGAQVELNGHVSLVDGELILAIDSPPRLH